MTEWSRRELSFPLIPHAELQALKPLGPKLEDYIRQLEELLRSLLFGIDSPSYPDGESPLFTPGSVIFAGASGGLAEDNANFFYDDANNRLGIGLNNPRDGIEVNDLLVFDPILFNVLAGTSAGAAITTGASETIVGYQAGLDLTSGANNTLMGYQAGANLTTDHDNVMIGYQAGFTQVGMVTADRANVYIGSQAGYSQTVDGYGNVSIGYQAGKSATNSNKNVFIGYRAGYDIYDFNPLVNCVCIGYRAGYFMTGTGSGADNIFIGSDAGYGTNDAFSYINIGIGTQALESLTSGNKNVGIGYQSLQALESGQFNTCIGLGSFTLLTTGSYNTCVGEAGMYVATGSNNTFIGHEAGYLPNAASSNNTTVGYRAGRGGSANAYSYNTLFGSDSGYGLLTGSSNVFIGYRSGFYETTNSNRFYVNNRDCVSLVREEYESLFHGIFAATSGAQDLNINADVLIRNDATLGLECLNETDFATHVKWDVTGDFSDTGGKAAYTHSTGAGTLTQTAANLATAGVANKWYRFAYSAGGGSATSITITTSFAASAVSLPVTLGSHVVYFKAAASPSDFVISATSVSGGFWIDDVSLKELQGGDLIVNGALSARSMTVPTYVGPVDISGTVQVDKLEIDNISTYIDKDGSGNMTFTDAVTGTRTLKNIGCPVYHYIKATGQAEGDLHLSDGTNWAISKALIKYIRVITSSTDWDLYILQNDNGYATDDATIPKMKIANGIVGNANLWLDLPYQDEDATGEVHLYYLDNSGANTATIIIKATELV